ncbi:MAG: lysylphosphatidylglycerol synthase domain-containing protein [Thermodesulfobacteriota bacterium]
MNPLLKKGIALFWGYGIGGAIFFLLGKLVSKNWESFLQHSMTMHWPLLFLATGVGLFTIIFRYGIYRTILLKIDPKLKVGNRELFRVFLYSWLARYLPGKIWLPVGKIYFGTRSGINRGSMFLSTFFELILSTLGNLIGAIVAFLIFFRSLYPNYHLYLFFLIVGMIFIVVIIQRPFLIFIMDNILKKISKSEELPESIIHYRDMLRIVGHYFLLTVGMSVSFLCFIITVIEVNSSNFLAIMGSFIVANFLATISFFTPAGLGVKEGILVALLAPMINLPIAGGVTIASRLFFIGLDLFTFILYKIYERISLFR